MTKTTVKTLSISDLASNLADKHEISKSLAKNIVDSLRDEIVQTLVEDGRVSIFGLGTFETRETKAKTGRNPKTGETIQIPAGRKVSFKAAKGLKDQM